MNEVLLTKYGPFVVGEFLPYTNWKVAKIVWDTDDDFVTLTYNNGKDKIVKTIPYSQKEHQETSLILDKRKKKEKEMKELEDKLEQLRMKIFEKHIKNKKQP